jgi:hypothetical protein
MGGEAGCDGADVGLGAEPITFVDPNSSGGAGDDLGTDGFGALVGGSGTGIGLKEPDDVD